jgi:hypothetical protein
LSLHGNSAAQAIGPDIRGYRRIQTANHRCLSLALARQHLPVTWVYLERLDGAVLLGLDIPGLKVDRVTCDLYDPAGHESRILWDQHVGWSRWRFLLSYGEPRTDAGQGDGEKQLAVHVSSFVLLASG